ncbi:MAG: hypothetical protein IT363_08660 [Methanoregulaceae archaeon]|nr:hypothetical protein [Methanoregulaceae archaeon]
MAAAAEAAATAKTTGKCRDFRAAAKTHFAAEQHVNILRVGALNLDAVKASLVGRRNLIRRNRGATAGVDVLFLLDDHVGTSFHSPSRIDLVEDIAQNGIERHVLHADRDRALNIRSDCVVGDTN